METRRVTVYLDSEVHRYLARKAAQSDQSVSQVVNQAVRSVLAEDEENLKAFRERAREPNLDFADVVRSLRRRGKI